MSNAPIVPGDLFELIVSQELFMILHRRGAYGWALLRIGSISDAEDWESNDALLSDRIYRRIA
jgi:hypothetical protein